MNDISNKTSTLREASAEGTVFCSQETIQKIRNNQVPKGNIFEFARAAAFFGAKKTEQLLPHCHPVTIDGMTIEFELNDNCIHILGTAKSIGRTGIEMEILTGVSIAALTIYDMLKPLDKGLEISGIKLLEKKGGKSDRETYFNTPPACAILICSEEMKIHNREDKVGPIVKELLEKNKIEDITLQVVGNEITEIQEAIKIFVEEGKKYIFTLGGTGLGKRDTTFLAVERLIDQRLEGITDAMRIHAYARNPLAITSKLIAGTFDEATIITLPGSEEGAKESLEAILPAVFKIQKMLLKTI